MNLRMLLLIKIERSKIRSATRASYREYNKILDRMLKIQISYLSLLNFIRIVNIFVIIKILPYSRSLRYYIDQLIILIIVES